MTDINWRMPSPSAVAADRALLAKVLDLMAARGVVIHGAREPGCCCGDWYDLWERYCFGGAPDGETGVFWDAEGARATFEGDEDSHYYRYDGRTPLYLQWYGDLGLLSATLREVGIDFIAPRAPQEALSLCFPSTADWAMPY